MLSFPMRFFGHGQVLSPEGQPITLRSRKLLALLAFLALEHQRPHSREALAAQFWPDDSAAAAQNNLRVTLSRLRDVGKQLPAEPAQELLQVSRLAVQLSAAWVERADVNYFSQLIERTLRHAHAERGQCSHCQAQLQAAVAAYGGELLSGFRLDHCPLFEEWLALQRERQRRLLLDAFADLATYAEEHSDHHAAREYAQRQIELDPLREAAYRQLMRSLAGQGDRSGALACFERCRALLHDELGLDPEPATLALHREILSGAISPESRAPTSVAQPPQAALGRALPQPLTLFVGREQELVLLLQRIAEPGNRLLSIIGPGGVGKSRLSLQLAAQAQPNFADGAAFVPLAQIAAIESLPAAVAEALGLEFAASQRSAFEQLTAMLRDRQLLLVLDNFEHLTAGAGLLVELLERAPHVTLVVTSRERLSLQAEDLFELHGLPVPAEGATIRLDEYAAVRMFVDRARRVNKSFAAGAAQLPEIVRICRLLEGFPLAIELAASWASEFDGTEILHELAGAPGRLETALRNVAPHHRSLRAVFTTSWRLLSDPERLALRQLALFRGGFTVEAAREVAGCPTAVLRSLRDKSLLRQAGPQRYDMHMLVQQFAAEALAEDAQLEAAARARLDRFFLALLTARAAQLDTNEARVAADQIQPDWENVSMAWQHAAELGEHLLLLEALDGLVHFCDLRGLYQEAQTLLEYSLAECNTAEQTKGPRSMLVCRLLTALAYFAGRRGLSQTVPLSEQALALARELNDSPSLVTNLAVQAYMADQAADYARARTLASEGLRIAEVEGLDTHAALCLDSLGIVALVSGNFALADELYRRLLSIHRRSGRSERRGRVALGRLGSVATEQGRYDEALHYLEEYLGSSRRVDDRHSVPDALHDLAFLWQRLGNYAQVLVLESESVARSRAIGDLELTSLSLHNKACAHRVLGELPEALSCATEAVALARQLDARLALAHALKQLADVQVELARQEYDWLEAAANFREAAASFRTFGKLVMAYEAEIGLAALLWRRGDFPAAYEQIVGIVAHLPAERADGWDEPLRAYLVCVQILRAVGDPSAEAVLAQGLHLLDSLEQRIADPRLRRSFAEAIREHRMLRAMAQRASYSVG